MLKPFTVFKLQEDYILFFMHILHWGKQLENMSDNYRIPVENCITQLLIAVGYYFSICMHVYLF